MYRKFINICCILVLVAGGLISTAQSAQAQEPEPVFHIVPDHGYACSANWGIGDPITITIKDLGGAIIHQETIDSVHAWWDETGTLGEACFGFESGMVQPQMYVSITDGTTLKETWIVDLSFDSVSTDGTASGTGPPGETGYLCMDWGSECLTVTVSSTGEWTESFVGYDPTSTDLSAAHIKFSDLDWDDTVAYLVSPPYIDVNVTYDWVGAWGFSWGDDSVFLEVLGADDTFKCGGNFVLSEGDPGLDCGQDGHDILPGDQVLLYLNDDLDPSKTLTVMDLTLDEVELADGYFAGSAPEGAQVQVDGCNPDDTCFHGLVIASEGNTWSMTLGGVDPEAWYFAYILDQDGDKTMADLFVEEPPPLPAFTVHPEHGWVGGWGWYFGEQITVSIDDDEDLTNGTIIQFTALPGDPEWDPNSGDIFFELWDQGDIFQVDRYVSVSDGNTTKMTQIVPLSFDSVTTDDTPGLASGIGPPFGEGHVCLDHFSGCLPITVSEQGTWSAYFDWYDPEMELYDAHIVIWDDDWDENMANLPVEEPQWVSISAYPQFDQINGNGFPIGETITLVIDNDLDPSNGNLYYATAEAGPFSEDEPDVSLVRFYLEGLFDVQSGQYLIMFFEDLFQIHQVEYLNILEVDLTADEVQGLADAGEQVEVWIYWNKMILTDVDGSGFWTADFSVGPSVWDLQYGDLVTAGVLDEAGNGTWHYYLYSPVAEDDVYLVDEDQVLTEPAPGVLANDYHAGPGPIEAELISGPDYGQVVLNLDGSFSYTPDPDFFGQDSFSYRAKDDRVQSEPAVVTITVDPVNDAPVVSLPSVFSIDEGQTFLGSGTFQDPDPDTWTGTVDYGDGSPQQTLSLTTHQSFDLVHNYSESGIYTISVVINDGSVAGTGSTEVVVNNLAPSVSITSLAGGEDTVLVGLDVALVASFFDPGLDFHTALIDWGDGTEVIDPALSPLVANHIYSSPGLYTIILTVTDDDGGSGTTSASLTVIEPADAAEGVIAELDSILTDPDLPPETAAAIEDALVDLEGANDGLSSSGALDKIVGGQWNAALVKIERAIQDLEAAEAVDPSLDLSDLKETLILIAKSVTLEIIATAQADGVPAALIDQAYTLVSAGQALLDAGDYLGAVGKFLDALHVL